MRWKALAVKILVYGTFSITTTAILFLVVYRLRHPEMGDVETAHYQWQTIAQPTETQESNARQYQQEAKESRCDSYLCKATEPMTLLTAALVLGVFATNWIYYKQLKKMEAAVSFAGKQTEAAQGQLTAMRDQLGTMKDQRDLLKRDIESAEKSSIYANRAYLVAKIRNDEAYHFKLAIENGGNTPANNVIVSYSCKVMQDPPWQLDEQTKQVIYDAGFDMEKRLGVIAPNGSHGTVETVAFAPKTAIARREWEDGVKLFCWGRIYYEDMFNKERHTDFCFYKSLKKPEGDPSEYGNEVF